MYLYLIDYSVPSLQISYCCLGRQKYFPFVQVPSLKDADIGARTCPKYSTIQINPSSSLTSKVHLALWPVKPTSPISGQKYMSGILFQSYRITTRCTRFYSVSTGSRELEFRFFHMLIGKDPLTLRNPEWIVIVLTLQGVVGVTPKISWCGRTVFEWSAFGLSVHKLRWIPLLMQSTWEYLWVDNACKIPQLPDAFDSHMLP